MANRQQIHQEIQQMFGQVPQWISKIPDSALAGVWGTMRDLQFGETKLDAKTKELIGIGIAGATRCRYCALFHTEAARLAGATDEEIAEAAMMAGFSMNASTFLNAMQIDYEQFKRETREIVEYVKMQQAKQGKPAAAPKPGARPH